jgi:hypothetical protein
MTFGAGAFALGRDAVPAGLGLAPGVPAPAPFVPGRSFRSLYPLVFCDLDAARARPIASAFVGRTGAAAGPDVGDSIDVGDSVDVDGDVGADADTGAGPDRGCSCSCCCWLLWLRRRERAPALSAWSLRSRRRRTRDRRILRSTNATNAGTTRLRTLARLGARADELVLRQALVFLPVDHLPRAALELA